MTPPSQCSITPLPLKQLSHVFENDLKASLSSFVFDKGVTFISGIQRPKSMAGSHTWKSESGEYLNMSKHPSRFICGTGGCLCNSFLRVMKVRALSLSVTVWRRLARPRHLRMKRKCVQTYVSEESLDLSFRQLLNMV